MKLLIEKLGISVLHLKCLDSIFSENHEEYQRIDSILNSNEFGQIYNEISKQLYAGGKKSTGNLKLARQMILGDVIEYIFTGRAYYYAAKSKDNFRNFLKLILYSVNQLLIYDLITVNKDIRKLYINKLEEEIDFQILYEKAGDSELANSLKESESILNDNEWEQYDLFVDSILPKTLGCPKELIVFAELLKSKTGIIIPLLLIQRLFGTKDPIAPPDFLLLKENKEIFGIEVGYLKEGQNREFSIRTSIPTLAVDLENNMHNRCPKCGEIILYCDPIIEKYSNDTLKDHLNDKGKYICFDCPKFDEGNCKFSNYYGKWNGTEFNGRESKKEPRHYHAKCVKDETYTYIRNPRNIFEHHKKDFFAQIPQIQGLESL